MTTQKHKGSKNRRSKKYRGGNDSPRSSNSSVSRDTDSLRLSELSDELNSLVEPYKKAKMWNNFAYGATFVVLATVIGIGVLTKMKKY
jgi:hypothetical protein